MKYPALLDKLSIAERSDGPYPPNGFVAFYEAELGNGDYYGLYWPIGMENSEPIICDMFHDEWRMEPAFSTLDIFLQWLELNDGNRGDRQVRDDGMSLNRLNEAKIAIGKNDPASAARILQSACEQLPEVSGYWSLLAGQHFRLGNEDAGRGAAVQAYCSNWTFGLPAENVLGLLKRAARVNADQKEPLLKRVGEFDLKYGGTKENRNYPAMKAIIDEYWETNPVFALRLHQNYAYMISAETSAFRDRCGFDVEAWRIEHAELCSIHLGDKRRFQAQ